MAEDITRIEVTNWPMTKDGRLRVELVPMPSGDNPWRTRGEYDEDQSRMKYMALSAIVSALAAIASAAIATAAWLTHS